MNSTHPTESGTSNAGNASTSGKQSASPEKQPESPEKLPKQWANTLTALIMAVIGLVFIWLYDQHEVQTTVLILAGLAFIIPGVALLLSMTVRPAKTSRGSVMTFMTAICGMAALAVGVVILVSPDTFRPYLVYLFGGLLIVGAAWQFDLMMRKNRAVLYPSWLVVAPVIVVALGVMMCTMEIFRGETNEKWMLLGSGCGFTLFGIIGLCISYFALKTAHQLRKAAKAAEAKAAEAKETENSEASEKSENSEASEKSEKSENSENHETPKAAEESADAENHIEG